MEKRGSLSSESPIFSYIHHGRELEKIPFKSSFVVLTSQLGKTKCKDDSLTNFPRPTLLEWKDPLHPNGVY